jgi:uncharacterized protein (DUF4213/DUF364 family)
MEPISYFYNKFHFDKTKIKRIVIGEKYVGIMLKNGHIGVCSTLHHRVENGLFNEEILDPGNLSHRIIYNAYLNANCNYDNEFLTSLDIFDHIDFIKKEKIVMIGFFKPLVKKFTSANIDLHIFDKLLEDEILSPMSEMNQSISEASTLILTSTSVFNGSFTNIIKKTNDNCDVYLLGPSSILHPEMKNYKNVKQVYGAVFEPNDERILDIIEAGHGTQTFLPLGRKVHI